MKKFVLLFFVIPLFSSAQKLQDAVLRRDTVSIIALIQKGVDVNGKDMNGSSALLVAARWGDINIVKLLLDNGATADEPRSPKGRTPLMVACTFYSGATVCGMLIKKGADVNAKSKESETPLMLAAQSAKLNVVELLLAQGANAKMKNDRGETALDYAVKSDAVIFAKEGFKDCVLDKDGVIARLKAALGQ